MSGSKGRPGLISYQTGEGLEVRLFLSALRSSAGWGDNRAWGNVVSLCRSPQADASRHVSASQPATHSIIPLEMSAETVTNQTGPGTRVRQNVASREFRAAGLFKAHSLLHRHGIHALNLPLRELWELFPTKYVLAEVRQHLVDMGFLVDGKWNGVNRR